MVALLTNLKVVIISLVLVNAVLLLLFKGNLRFVKGPLVFFIFLIMAALSYRLLVFPAVNKKIEQEKETEIKRRGWGYLNEPDLDAGFIKRKNENSLINAALFRITGLQTIFAFVFALVGIFTTSSKKLYSLYALGYFIVALLLWR